MANRNVFKNKSFLFVWIGNAVSELGGALGTFCNSILVYQLTGSSMALGSMWLLYYLPSLVLQLFIGPFIDRWSRKKIMIYSQWVRALIFLIPLFLFISDSLLPWHIFFVQIIVGVVSPLYTPANQAIIPSVVSKDHLTVANAYIDGTVRLMTFLAPIIGGIIAEYIGVKITLILTFMLFAVSGTLLIFIKETRIANDHRSTWLKQFTEGIYCFFQQPIIVWLAFFLAFVQFGVGVTLVVTLPYITEILSGSYEDYGYFMACFPLGYVIGTMLVGKIKFVSRRHLMLGALTIGGLTFISLGFNSSIYIAFMTELIAGIAFSFFGVHNVTICQQAIPNHLRGKVFSVRLFIIRAALPIGVLFASLFSEVLGIRALYLLIGSLICTVSLIGITLPYFKFIDDKNDEKNIASES